MSSSSDPAESVRGGLDISILKSWDFGAWQAAHGADQLPYRIDHLRRRGIRLHWTDRLHEEEWQKSRASAAVSSLERAGVPFLQTLLLSRQIRRTDATIAMFESEGNFLAAVRNLAPRSRRSPLVVVSCWLADLLTRSSSARLRGYRAAYRSVDLLYCFSRDQTDVLRAALELDSDRVRFLPFGVDVDTFSPTGGPDDSYVLAVGRDRGRDWPTFFRAVDGLDVPVKVLCRPSQIEGLTVPSNVEILGHVDRETYRALLGRAAVVVVLTRPVGYPSGQSVLLEAMAMARTVVASKTPSLEDYMRDGTDCLAVPPFDPGAARERIEEALRDDSLRSRIGTSARWRAESDFDSRRMWDAVADDLYRLCGSRA